MLILSGGVLLVVGLIIPFKKNEKKGGFWFLDKFLRFVQCSAGAGKVESQSQLNCFAERRPVS